MKIELSIIWSTDFYNREASLLKAVNHKRVGAGAAEVPGDPKGHFFGGVFLSFFGGVFFSFFGVVFFSFFGGVFFSFFGGVFFSFFGGVFFSFFGGVFFSFFGGVFFSFFGGVFFSFFGGVFLSRGEEVDERGTIAEQRLPQLRCHPISLVEDSVVQKARPD